MSKRAPGLKRNLHDIYDTPLSPVATLLPHLKPGTRFIEPCAGRGDLIRHLEVQGHLCVGAFDIAPRSDGRVIIDKLDALKLDIGKHGGDCDAIITNPPWSRDILHALILRLYWQRPTYLLFDAEWAQNKIAAPYLPLCSKIIPAGRVKWIEGSAHASMDSVCWYCFEPRGRPEFYARLP